MEFRLRQIHARRHYSVAAGVVVAAASAAAQLHLFSATKLASFASLDLFWQFNLIQHEKTFLIRFPSRFRDWIICTTGHLNTRFCERHRLHLQND